MDASRLVDATHNLMVDVSRLVDVPIWLMPPMFSRVPACVMYFLFPRSYSDTLNAGTDLLIHVHEHTPGTLALHASKDRCVSCILYLSAI